MKEKNSKKPSQTNKRGIKKAFEEFLESIQSYLDTLVLLYSKKIGKEFSVFGIRFFYFLASLAFFVGGLVFLGSFGYFSLLDFGLTQKQSFGILSVVFFLISFLFLFSSTKTKK